VLPPLPFVAPIILLGLSKRNLIKNILAAMGINLKIKAHKSAGIQGEKRISIRVEKNFTPGAVVRL